MKALITLPAFAVAATALLLTSCGRDYNDTGLEYAPQMYHSIPYEPYSQILDTNSEDYNTNPYDQNGNVNFTGSNLRKPVTGTIKRKIYSGTTQTTLADNIMEYDIPHPDSIEWSARNLSNPLPATDKVLAEGKVLYLQFCSPCHGPEGKANGKVAEKYNGVPAYNTGRVKLVNGGHIYHTITFGKGRMWPHGSQVNPNDRWKIVHYVQTLQQQPQ